LFEITNLKLEMSTRYAYSMLFREFNYFGDESSDGWQPNGFNWVTSEQGTKIAVVDLKNKLIHVLSAPDTVQGQSQVDTVSNQADAGTLTAASLLTIASSTAFSWTIALSTDGIYKQALIQDPYLNFDASNFSVWINGMMVAATTLLREGRLAPELGTAATFSGIPRTHVFSSAAMSDLDDGVLISTNDLSNPTNNIVTVALDGQLGNNTLQFSSGLQKLMTAGVIVNMEDGTATLSARGITININFDNFTSIGGTDLNDTITGTSSRDYFDPGLGTDIIYGGGSGHSGSLGSKDRVSYWGEVNSKNVKTGIVVTADVIKHNNLWVPYATVKDVGGSTDTLYDISLVVGSMGDDTYNGDKGSSANAYSKASAADKNFGGIKSYRGEFAGFGGKDIINGNNLTRVSYVYDPAGVTVNLGTIAVKSSTGVSVLPGTALDGFGSVDTLKNVTGIRGSDEDDRIYLSINNDVVTGEQGDDYIFGDRGDDDIWGTAGSDTLSGGAGIDILVGDGFRLDTTNLEQDFFVFSSVTEAAGKNSITGKSWDEKDVRVGDVITDFQLQIDLIDLSSIDANIKKRGDQKFTLSVQDTFSKLAGELILVDGTLALSDDSSKPNYLPFAADIRSRNADTYTDSSAKTYEQSGVYLMGDVQGDGKADFAIFIVGQTYISLSDATLTDWLKP
jgi:Ca2+-binding RTX toxin-like protein